MPPAASPPAPTEQEAMWASNHSVFQKRMYKITVLEIHVHSYTVLQFASGWCMVAERINFICSSKSTWPQLYAVLE